MKFQDQIGSIPLLPSWDATVLLYLFETADNIFEVEDKLIIVGRHAQRIKCLLPDIVKFNLMFVLDFRGNWWLLP